MSGGDLLAPHGELPFRILAVVGLLFLASITDGWGEEPLVAANGLPVHEQEPYSPHRDFPAPLVSALKEVESKSSRQYPETVQTLPEPEALDKAAPEVLLEMAHSWNPAHVEYLGRRLADQGDAVLPILKRMMLSGDPDRRKTAALLTRSIVQHQVKNPHAYFPEEPSWRQALPKVRTKHADLVPILAALLEGEDRTTLDAAVKIAGLLEVRNPGISDALLGLMAHPDEHLAQSAAVRIARWVGVEGIPQDRLFEALQVGMQNPLPSGRGFLIKLIAKQDEAFQRRCIPLILRHLKWNAKRDTMFDATGMVEGMKILAALGDPAMIEITPFMMKKRHKGNMFYIEDAVKASASMGEKAAGLPPLYRSTLKEAEDEMLEIRKRKALRHIDRIRIKALEKRIEVLKEGIAHVEK